MKHHFLPELSAALQLPCTMWSSSRKVVPSHWQPQSSEVVGAGALTRLPIVMDTRTQAAIRGINILFMLTVEQVEVLSRMIGKWSPDGERFSLYKTLGWIGISSAWKFGVLLPAWFWRSGKFPFPIIHHGQLWRCSFFPVSKFPKSWFYQQYVYPKTFLQSTPSSQNDDQP